LVEHPADGGTKVGVTGLLFIAEVAHLVEHDLAKVGVAGSSPVFRSDPVPPEAERDFFCVTRVVELVDTSR
jgi:hypothetical protein